MTPTMYFDGVAAKTLCCYDICFLLAAHVSGVKSENQTRHMRIARVQ